MTAFLPHLVFYVSFAVAIVAALVIKPVAQDKTFHNFADTRRLFGIPNIGDVVSNGLYTVIGVYALIQLFWGPLGASFASWQIMAPYVVFFGGVALLGIGSGYYHWNPNNQTLLWDRLPMVITFMALLSALLADRVDASLGIWSLLPLQMFGLGTVVWWHMTEQRGQGDLRLYGVVQFYPLLIMPVLVLITPAGTWFGGLGFWLYLGFYGLAKLVECLDKAIYRLTGRIISGHTIKHLFLACGRLSILYMLLQAAAR
ncbi:MAG: alkaline phytoceramidase [Proteobacteria bacterium]|nr:alkaline phytoceramidase [Pseudomonadota bacterium]